jgi:hypothetical protein
MRKFSLFLSLALLCLAVAIGITWTNRENILAHFMSRQLRVPVSIRTLDISKTSAEITRMWIGNFPKSQTATSFTAETLRLDATLDQIFGNPVTIEQIDINDIFVGIEFYDAKGNDSNWGRILNENRQKKSHSREYLIRTLILRNLTVELTQANGKVKRYPTIKQMEFHNISSASGFPVEEIEKAIFDMMMKDIFKKFQLDQLFKTIIPVPIPFLS